jgi:hypothetical protein
VGHELAQALGLYGPAMLANGPLADLHAALSPPSRPAAGGCGGAGGCSGGCGGGCGGCGGG